MNTRPAIFPAKTLGVIVAALGMLSVGGTRLVALLPAFVDFPKEGEERLKNESPATAAKETGPRPREAAPEPPRAVPPVAYCFGPLFGNNEREPDPNYMPLPVATLPAGEQAATIVQARYTRVSESDSGLTTWAGNNGSEIRYLTRTWSGDNRAAAARGAAARRQDGEELIKENREELTRLSWDRVRKLHPNLVEERGAGREAFEAFVLERRATPRAAEVFAKPNWPELLAASFVSERDRAAAEEASWGRVRAKVRVFNDPENFYTRRFIDFTESLRSNPESSGIFREATWPEKVLELHDERLGPVPTGLR